MTSRQWPEIKALDSSTHSRSVSTTLHLGAAEFAFIVGATCHGSDPWPEPRCYMPSPLALESTEVATVLEVLRVLFERYAVTYP